MIPYKVSGIGQTWSTNLSDNDDDLGSLFDLAVLLLDLRSSSSLEYSYSQHQLFGIVTE